MAALFPAFPALLLHLRSTSTRASLSTGCAGHWTVPYRRRLGIGNSPLVYFSENNWKPPNPGELKIIFQSFAPPTKDESGLKTCGFLANAVNSSVETCGFSFGSIDFRSNLGAELYAARGAADLAGELRKLGVHDGPVVYETNLKLLTMVMDGSCEGEREELVKEAMPEDLEEASSRFFQHYGGEPDELARSLHPLVRPMFEEMNKV